jgi:hypothetical protein
MILSVSFAPWTAFSSKSRQLRLGGLKCVGEAFTDLLRRLAHRVSGGVQQLFGGTHDAFQVGREFVGGAHNVFLWIGLIFGFGPSLREQTVRQIRSFRCAGIGNR